jgi:putative phosphoribosyl transferase
LDLGGRTVIVVDDGLATGGTARAALRAVRAQRPRRLILAVPVGARDSVAALRKEADDVICVREPDPFWAVGAWYANFAQTPDTEVAQLLGGTATTPVVASGVGAREVRIEVGPSDHIVGDLVVPERALGIVVFAHGSGSSRMSPRNRWVATALNDGGFATLLLDLLTPAEALDRANVFDIALLADRLVAASAWLSCEPAVGKLSLGYFGASTGAGAALWAAAAPGAAVRALVSRGGRPDLAMPRLADVHAPVLLIVGGRDDVVLQLNREAQRHLGGVSELAVVPDATHLFEEPGALEEVSRLAVDWFDRHLAGQVTSSGPMR